ncbi:hypothetical protein [Herbaspirillum huttiense]|uniref:Pyocin activator protein PrtN n=2 Tax=Herbaspirillum huttiense TaxID=863372 RepID=A0AAJ2HC12_9BURK|nr:hypothetical protein [Herbaspirillum huttiense]MDR9837807.1 hypothetical protein [Herbaspirillum huttiense]
MTSEFNSEDGHLDLDILMARELTRQYGPLLSGENLRLALGYASKEAYRMAMARKTLPVPVFDIEFRRGKFALTLDVAKWLVEQRMKAVPGTIEGEEP